MESKSGNPRLGEEEEIERTTLTTPWQLVDDSTVPAHTMNKARSASVESLEVITSASPYSMGDIHSPATVLSVRIG